MLFMDNMMHYNIPQKKFIVDNIYTSFSKVGNYLKSGFIGPDGSTSIDFNKRASMMKSFSEILERRALFAGGFIHSENRVYAFNLLKREMDLINVKYSSYLIEKDYSIDTTGSAAHTNSKYAIYNAIKELIEKNALFHFWYGLCGMRVIIKEMCTNEKKIIDILSRTGKDVIFYYNDFFHPLKVVFSFVIKDRNICSSGVGSAFSISEAMNKSLQEAYLLLWKDETLELVESRKSYFIKKYDDHSDCLNHLYKIKSILTVNPNGCGKINHEYDLNCLLELLPSWIKDIYLIPLNQNIRNGMKCVKVFSPYMYNHVPNKQHLNLNNPMNTNTLRINEQTLSSIPNCIVT
ncbi:YcaO-like family protein [Paenibacillus profundus]|uniref:YcaO-like family protein n=1 Tax=Paenibacillus profundus TaxID=1173085 RepID=A0ABS8YA08_9BACL|nr:YcaO-like family protein [Paenibacillus profundus]MCE5168301.1 YcaO-like family protein [Paenibacillus profundus]